MRTSLSQRRSGYRMVSFRRLGQGGDAEILGEMTDRAHHRIGREATERAERSELHRLAQILDQLELGLRIARGARDVAHLGDRLDAIGGLAASRAKPVERFDAARR